MTSYEAEQVWFAQALYVREWDLDFHQLLLEDRLRMVAYQAAITAVVRPGMAVADVGTGTGILAQWALEAGARVVHAIEMNQAILAEARVRLGRAGLLDRCRLYGARSSDVQLPEPVDVVISEILGNLGDNEGMTPILNDARDRFLRPGGQMLPRRATTFLVPVAAELAWAQVVARSCRGLSSQYDLDSLLARLQVPSPFHIPYDVILPRRLHLAPPAPVAEFAFDGRDPDHYQRRLAFTVERVGLFTGWKGTFAAELAEGVLLDISGDDIAAGQASDSWKHAYLPIGHPVEVQPGDVIELDYRRAPAPVRPANDCFTPRLTWSGCVRRNGRPLAAFSHGPISGSPRARGPAPADTAA
jgi:2-polyprenyl-3-methyl-5-hydroxy-6-metoxy-1,4-benzoquinol methylase